MALIVLATTGNIAAIIGITLAIGIPVVLAILTIRENDSV